MINTAEARAKDTERELPSSTAASKTSTAFKVLEIVSLAGIIGAGSFLTFFWEDEQTLVGALISLLVFIVLFGLGGQLSRYYVGVAQQREMERKAQLFSYPLTHVGDMEAIALLREKALLYCQDLISGYKKTRRDCRNLYYFLQVVTIVLSSLTPILVLLERGDIGAPWLKWLPVIFPAIAAIVTSLSTSFPLQEQWIAANTTVEQLEAEQEKFILGITQPYRCFDSRPEERHTKAQKATENFIVQVNKIHLKQVMSMAESQPEGGSANGTPPPETPASQGGSVGGTLLPKTPAS